MATGICHFGRREHRVSAAAGTRAGGCHRSGDGSSGSWSRNWRTRVSEAGIMDRIVALVRSGPAPPDGRRVLRPGPARRASLGPGRRLGASSAPARPRRGVGELSFPRHPAGTERGDRSFRPGRRLFDADRTSSPQAITTSLPRRQSRSERPPTLPSRRVLAGRASGRLVPRLVSCRSRTHSNAARRRSRAARRRHSPSVCKTTSAPLDAPAGSGRP